MSPKYSKELELKGLISAAKDRFTNVQRFAPMASRNASSETYLVCRNRLPKPRKRALERVHIHRFKNILQRLVSTLRMVKNNKKLLVVFVDLVRKKKNDSFRVAGESLGISVVWDNILPFRSIRTCNDCLDPIYI